MGEASRITEVVKRLRLRGDDRSHHTEFVPNGVLHDDPRMFALADFETFRAKLFKTLNLGFLGCVYRTDIEVQPVLVQLLILRYVEDDRRSGRMASNGHLCPITVGDSIVECRTPETCGYIWLGAVDDDLAYS